MKTTKIYFFIMVIMFICICFYSCISTRETYTNKTFIEKPSIIYNATLQYFKKDFRYKILEEKGNKCIIANFDKGGLVNPNQFNLINSTRLPDDLDPFPAFKKPRITVNFKQSNDTISIVSMTIIDLALSGSWSDNVLSPEEELDALWKSREKVETSVLMLYYKRVFEGIQNQINK